MNKSNFHMFGLSAALCAAMCVLSAKADTVWLDEPGIWDRMSGGHGRSWVCTNGQKMVMGSYSRGVGTCAPSALYLAMNGNAISFEATVGQLYGPNKSKLTFRVYRERELAFETPVLDKDSGPHRIKVSLEGARWVKLEAHGIESPYSGTSIWGDAKFEMKPGTRPQDIATLSPQLGILTPPPAKSPRINGPAIFGARPGNPVLYRVPVTGERPLEISIGGLDAPGLEGVTFDAKSQLLTGKVAKTGTYPLAIRASNAHGRAERRFRLVIGEKIALTPPLGWNSWNAFANTVTAQIVKDTADEMARLGLGDHGWTYLTIDDGWQVSIKSKKPRRDAQGRQLSNETFPDMKGLADHVHSRGFKIGLYSSPGPQTCAGYEGSWMHEFQDAKTYAEWGYDYLKHDWCSYGSIAFGEGAERWMYPYLVMGRALRESGRDIVHSICEYGVENVASWGAAALGQCWRTTGDKFDFWEDVATAMATHENLWRYAGPGAWNDADMMLIGSTHWSGHRGTRLTPNEQFTHVSMWAMWAAPMMIGCDLRGVDPFTLSLITNDEVLDISQDELGAAAAKIQGGDDWACWARPLADGSIAAALVNLSPYPQEVLFCLKKAGMVGTWMVRDVWRQRNAGNATGGYRAQVPGHATQLVRFIPGKDAHLREGLGDVRENDWFRRIETFRTLAADDCDGCGGRAGMADAMAGGGKLKVGYYIGRGGRGNWGLGWQNYLTHSPDIDLAWLDGEDVRAGRLEGLDVLVMPGGRSAWQAKSLGEDGMERIRDFLRRGGRYYGTCAGCSLTQNLPGLMRIIPYAKKSTVRRGDCIMKVAFNARAAELMGVKEGVHLVPYYSGPQLQRTADVPDCHDVEVLATFAGSIQQNPDAEPFPMQGLPAFITAGYGKGRLLVTALHPEYQPSTRDLISGGFKLLTGRKITFDFPRKERGSLRLGYFSPGIMGKESYLPAAELDAMPRVDFRAVDDEVAARGELSHCDVLVIPDGDQPLLEKYMTPEMRGLIADFAGKGGQVFAWGRSARFLPKVNAKAFTASADALAAVQAMSERR